ncbi:hypothetical protein B005_0996 [Nocardiopsis alba ATCC BAA-2165]|uniref:Uncharacterized protein n=1 Tax=Nocardiopsis alba (strain ATCC BAA-2165 / BE74) TaxID=1205910 RepID=J7L3G5_NOCAA|nr:hypothetical protein B005_0996 [Nocardiopsis alba ATCC BAA-2165]
MNGEGPTGRPGRVLAPTLVRSRDSRKVARETPASGTST